MKIIMLIKLALYCIFIPTCIWVVTATNIDRFFKKNSTYQIHFMYLMISLGLSYLTVNFLMDIYTIFIF